MYPCHTAFTRYPVFWCYIVQLFCQSIQLRSSHPKVFCKRGILRNFTKFFGKHLCQGLFFNKVAGPGTVTLLKKRLWHRCFPVNYAKFLRTLFLQNTSGGCFCKFFKEYARWSSRRSFVWCKHCRIWSINF